MVPKSREKYAEAKTLFIIIIFACGMILCVAYKQHSIVPVELRKCFNLLRRIDWGIYGKVGCVFHMVVVSIVPYAGFGPNDYREDKI